MSNEYNILKGIDKTVEFKGLSAQYLMFFAGGIFLLLIVFFIMRGLDTPVVLNILLMAILSFILLGSIFYFNNKYGRYGLMKKQARRNCPRFIISRKSFKAILR